ncbi:MAG: hypothetical protein ACYDCL_23420, partial [Myxococcales bacterium]
MFAKRPWLYFGGSMVPRGEAAVAKELAQALGRVDPPGSALDTLLPGLRRHLDADQAVAWSLLPGEPLQLDLCRTDGVRPGFAACFSDWLASAPPRFGLFDPLRPEPWQRNVALRHEDFPHPMAHLDAPVHALVRRWDIAPETLRLLACDGPVLLGWVGVNREAPFRRDECRRLQRLAPALCRRLRLERQLGAASLCAAALPAALEAIPAAAFLLGPGGAIRHANRAGEALLRQDSKALRESLRAHAANAGRRRAGTVGRGGRSREGPAAPTEICRAPRRSAPHFAVHTNPPPGLPPHHLAINLPGGNALDHRISLAAARWGLSDKLARVLALLVRGASNHT